MSRSLLGAGLGATGATLYLKPEVLQDWARDVMFGPSSRPAGPGGKELEQLQRLVRARRSPPASDAACRALGAPLPLQPLTRRYAMPQPPPQVEDLSRQVAAGQKGGVTVVHTGTSTTGRCASGRGWLLLLLGPAAAGRSADTLPMLLWRDCKPWP